MSKLNICKHSLVTAGDHLNGAHEAFMLIFCF